MSKTGDTLNSLLENWQLLKDQRPSESDFSPHGVQLSYSSLDEYFLRLKSLVDALDSKGYWTSSPEAAVADQPISSLLSTVNSLLINARSNGVGWMLGSGFLEALNSARQLIATLTRSQASLNKEIAKALTDKSEADIEAVISAAATARTITRLEADVQKRANKLSEESEKASEALGAISETHEKLAALADEVSSSAANIKGLEDDSKAAKDEIDQLRAAALAQEDSLAKRIEATQKTITTTDAEAKAALESVRQALKQVRDQGLAGAFQSRSRNLRNERFVWGSIFLASIILLVCLAIRFSVDLTELTYESLTVNLLRRLGLAAPAVWLGWYAATQLGRVSRVQEDYEYKTASALAYQSYKEEIGALENDALLEKLADLAISNFGESPVRLYEKGPHDDAVTPIQAAVKELPPEKIAAVLAVIGEQSIRSKLWPFGK